MLEGKDLELGSYGAEGFRGQDLALSVEGRVRIDCRVHGLSLCKLCSCSGTIIEGQALCRGI